MASTTDGQREPEMSGVSYWEGHSGRHPLVKQQSAIDKLKDDFAQSNDDQSAGSKSLNGTRMLRVWHTHRTGSIERFSKILNHALCSFPVSFYLNRTVEGTTEVN